MRHSFRALTALLALGACQIDDRATKERVDKMQAQADTIEQRMDKVARGGAAAGAAAAAAMPQPGRPDPGTVYSVSIEGAPVLGPATAKVTIVEVAEFA